MTANLLLTHGRESATLIDLGVRFVLDGNATGGRFSLVEYPLPARALGSPVHTHANEDEYSSSWKAASASS